MLTSNEQFEEYTGEKQQKRKLFNGFIKTDYYQYWAKVRTQRKSRNKEKTPETASSPASLRFILPLPAVRFCVAP